MHAGSLIWCGIGGVGGVLADALTMAPERWRRALANLLLMASEQRAIAANLLIYRENVNFFTWASRSNPVKTLHA